MAVGSFIHRNTKTMRLRSMEPADSKKESRGWENQLSLCILLVGYKDQISTHISKANKMESFIISECIEGQPKTQTQYLIP